MKTIIGILAAGLFGSAGSAWAQNAPADLQQKEIPEATRQQLQEAVERQSALLDRIFGVNVQTDGIVPMALKAKQPWQLLNPLAPPEYGNGFENTTRDPQTGRVKGISIFGVKF